MTSASQLSRVLNLVPYLLARQGIRIDLAAEDLGISVAQLRDDLTLLWMCGLPGYGPGDLIDIAFDDDTVTVTYDAGMSRPVRLSPDEALALVVALRILSDTPGLSDPDAVRRTLDKVAAAAGDAATMAGQVSVRTTIDDSTVDTYSRIVASGMALRLTYYSAGRDRSSERVVDPIRVVIADDHAYLHAWCRSADDVRRFRLDRIDAHTVLDEPAVVPSHARDRSDAPGAVFASGSADMPTIKFRVNRTARWVSEYYPCESVESGHDGTWIITMHARDLEWAKRLVLSLGTNAEAIDPPQLRDSVVAAAGEALRQYQDLGRRFSGWLRTSGGSVFNCGISLATLDGMAWWLILLIGFVIGCIVLAVAVAAVRGTTTRLRAAMIALDEHKLAASRVAARLNKLRPQLELLMERLPQGKSDDPTLRHDSVKIKT